MDIYGIIGDPVEHSLSPVMHNAAFKKLDIDAEYRKFEVKPEGLEDFLLNKKDVKGFNITIPHKVKAREILEKKFPFDENVSQVDLYYVKLSGAVNTVRRMGNRLEYWNTDPTGFFHSLDEEFDTKTRRTALLIGCGGAGRAIIASLSWRNMNINKIYVYDISAQAIIAAKEYFLNLPQGWGDILEEKLEFISSKEMPDKIKNCQLLVNASPVGMKEGDETSIIDKKWLHKDLSVYDLVYNRETRLVKDAKEKNLRAVDGRGMLAYQGAFSFSLWTGRKPAEVVGVMRKTLDNALENKK
ncbi:shikimate dehydrogenase family protein [Candidatus Omnitrophota bacterium]